MTERELTPPHLRIEMLSQPRYLAGVRSMMCAVSERLGFTKCDAGQIALAVDEALCNIIQHGYQKQPDGRIRISVWPIENTENEEYGIRIILEDEGRQVDPSCIKSRELKDIRPGGLGVHIIKKVMDTVQYSERDGKGMQLLLEKTGAQLIPHNEEPSEECQCLPDENN